MILQKRTYVWSLAKSNGSASDMATGENEQELRKITDLTRMLSVAVLCFHIYLTFHTCFLRWGLSSGITDRISGVVAKLGIFQSPWEAKGAALVLLVISLFGVTGKKDRDISRRYLIRQSVSGLALYFGSELLFAARLPAAMLVPAYSLLSLLGFMLVLAGGTGFSRLLKMNPAADIFNRDNETFPQEEKRLDNGYSVNLPAEYKLKGETRKSWINIINPFRGTLILGIPGSGKSYFAIRHFITQHILKGFSMFVYDFKFDDLTLIAYNTLLQNLEKYEVKPRFYVINFEDLNRSHRCNPLNPSQMTDISDAAEASRTIMLGLNREWIRRQGDFFVESAINFLTAIIWFLRNYRDGAYCTLPHVIELMQADYGKLFALLAAEPEIEVLINPFVSAWERKASDQLEGQVASARISMARLSSPALYYVLTGADMNLDINNPREPKIICMGNNPLKQQVFGAVISLYVSRMIRLVNQKNKMRSSLVFDEFPTIYLNQIDHLIATARSNLVSTTLAVQDYSQLKKDYGRDQAEVIMNMVGNIISGQVSGDTARQLSDRFGKILQERNSFSTNSHDFSVSRYSHLDAAVPASRIAALSAGEFVGMVADDPFNRIDLKVFHSMIRNDHHRIRTEESVYHPLPVIRNVSAEEIRGNYLQIKQDARSLWNSQIT
ncbi:MAG TPA: conjugal transfer protein MobC [Sphingobacteriaceae bacterium]